MSKNKAGFTLIEMVIIIPIAVFVVLGMVTAVISLTNQASLTNAITRRSNDIRYALDILEQDISLSNAFLVENSFDLDSSQRLNNQGFKVVNDHGQKQLILQSLVTTDNPLTTDSMKKLVHVKFGGSTDCALNPPMYSNTVYFIDNNTLYRRVLFPTDYADLHCEPAIWQQPTCRIVSGGFCKTEDMKLVENAELDIIFMTAAEPDTPLTFVFDTSFSPSERQKALDSAEIIRIQINSDVTEVEGDRPVVLTSALRASRIP